MVNRFLQLLYDRIPSSSSTGARNGERKEERNKETKKESERNRGRSERRRASRASPRLSRDEETGRVRGGHAGRPSGRAEEEEDTPGEADVAKTNAQSAPLEKTGRATYTTDTGGPSFGVKGQIGPGERDFSPRHANENRVINKSA